jgi:hypothetical protein
MIDCFFASFPALRGDDPQTTATARIPQVAPAYAGMVRKPNTALGFPA